MSNRDNYKADKAINYFKQYAALHTINLYRSLHMILQISVVASERGSLDFPENLTQPRADTVTLTQYWAGHWLKSFTINTFSSLVIQVRVTRICYDVAPSFQRR